MTYTGIDGKVYPNLCDYFDPGATCTDGYGNYMCNCSEAWKGKMCDEDVDECLNAASLSPPLILCENNGTCINTKGYYKCNCIPGAEGFNCSES
ncbi:hypothetical protein PFISCL1PPCAC_19268, partial [Pristionchus fissidentatus]